MKKGIILGALLIVVGVGLYAYYEHYIKYDREARELLTEGKLVYERGSRDAVNNAINIFSRVIARYRGSPSELEAYYYMAQCYEKLKLNDYAYLKYIYILKSSRSIDPDLKNKIRARIARLKTLRCRTDEGINQLFGVLNDTTDKGFRSRIYTELGYIYLQTGEYRKSKQMFDFARSEDGDNEEAILGKARVYKRLGNSPRAYDLYEYFLRCYGSFSHYAPDVRRSYINQVYQSGYWSFRKGYYKSAISYFNRLVRHYPSDRRAGNALYWIGESYLEQGKYPAAIKYFDRVLDNYDIRKDEDARIKKGYAYFLMKKFDLAAHEFQLYINSYPRGKYLDTAKKWKSMSTQELLYRIQERAGTESEEEMKTGDAENTVKPGKQSASPDKGMVDSGENSAADDIEYENVAEI
jgi:TolA-binding protein